MKKSLFFMVSLLIISILSFSQSTIILPNSTPSHILKTGTGSKGFSHTDGTIGVGTFVGTGAGWIQTHSNHPLLFSTNNGVAQMALTTNGRLGIGTSTPATTLDVISPIANVAKFTATTNQSTLLFAQNTNNITGYVGTYNDFANNSFEIGTSTATGSIFLSTNGTPRLTVTPAGYIKLGDNIATPAIKMKKLTGTTASTQGAISTIAHGLNDAKILSVQVLVEWNGSGGVVTNGSVIAGFLFTYNTGGGFITITNAPALGFNILSKPCRILITYEE
jgi:hypothetical protein